MVDTARWVDVIYIHSVQALSEILEADLKNVTPIVCIDTGRHDGLTLFHMPNYNNSTAL
jgi:hypothetical protein